MNERIRQLAETAGIDVETLMSPCHGGWPRDDLLVLTCFAVLIAQECIEAARTVGGNAGMEIETIIRNEFGMTEPTI